MPHKNRKSFPSRSERCRRELFKAAEDPIQSRITDYFKVLNKYDLVLKENEELRSVVELLSSKLSQLGTEDSPILDDMPVLLKALIESHINNKDKPKNARRYRNVLLRNFSVFSKDLAGKQSYEFWQKNLPLPALSTVASYSQTSGDAFIEGVFRFNELSAYLEERGGSKIVWLSEDGTRVVARVQYDAKTNQLVGLTPPLDEKGLPKIKAFDATTEDAIINMLKTNRTSNYAYVVMAQPLDDVPSFCLCIFGSNNIFTASQVLDRLKWTVQELRKWEITAIGLSADGDSRLLSVMKTLTFSTQENILPEWKHFFFASMNDKLTDHLSLVCVQDCIHTLAKLRNQLLKPRTDENFWPIGQYVISGSFLHILVSEKSKFQHLLAASDLDSKDKMNFRSIQKILDKRVIDALKPMPGAAGTRVFLIVVQGIMQAFLDKSLSPTERVYLMWRSVFFFRFWRVWLKKEKYKSTANFLTSNTYHCIEISSHSLVNVIRLLRNIGKPELFRTWLMDSQACEGYFRDARTVSSSMLTTAVNMTMLEFLQRSRKIERIGHLGVVLSETLVVPRHHKKIQDNTKTNIALSSIHLPSDDEILEEIYRARTDAVCLLKKTGVEFFDVPETTFADLQMKVDLDNSNVDTEEDVIEERESDVDDVEDVPQDVAEDLDINNSAEIENAETCDKPSIFVSCEIDGVTKKMRKSTVVWLHTSMKFCLSSDRQIRVKTAAGNVFSNQSSVTQVSICENLRLGEWCMFKNTPRPNCFLVGQVLSFCYLTGKGKGKTYVRTVVPTSTPENVQSRGIGVLCTWYLVEYESGSGKKYVEPHQYQDLDRYKCTLPRPTQESEEIIHYSEEVTKEVKKIMKWRKRTATHPHPDEQVASKSRRSTRFSVRGQ